MAHAILSPSSAHRWIPCPASVAMEQGLEDTAGPAAWEGTAAHCVAASVLMTGESLSVWKGTTLAIDTQTGDVADINAKKETCDG